MQFVKVTGEVIVPSKLVCIGRNYVAHIEELGNEVPDEMVVFIKPNSAIGDILRSQIGDEQLHYEGELAFAVRGGELAAVGGGDHDEGQGIAFDLEVLPERTAGCRVVAVDVGVDEFR